MKTNKWRKVALALALALGLGGWANAQDSLLEALNQTTNNASSTSAPANVGSMRAVFDSASDQIKERQRAAIDLIRRQQPAVESAPKKGDRYLVSFVQTEAFDFQSGKSVDVPTRKIAELNDALATFSLGASGFENIVTISGPWLNKKQVAKTFDILAKQTKPGDEIFVYWIGAGTTISEETDDGQTSGIDLEPKDEADGADELLCLYESGKTLTSLKDVQDSFLSDDELPALFKKLEGRRVFAFFETCYSGGLADPTQLVVTGRQTYAAEPKLPCVETWADLLEKADSTGQLATVDNFEAALKLHPLSQNDRGARYSTSSDSADSILERFFARRNYDSAPTSADLNKNVLKEFAVVFAACEQELNLAGMLRADRDGNLCYGMSNASTFALYVAATIGVGEMTPITFGDLRALVDFFVVGSNDLAREITEGKIGIQTPTYLSNMDDALLVDPARIPTDE